MVPKHMLLLFTSKIHDGASWYVLLKTIHTMTWCCGEFGFEKTLKTYVLKMEDVVRTKKLSRHA